MLVQNELVGAELGVSFGVSNVLFRTLCEFFLAALHWVVGWLAPLWPDLDSGSRWPGVSFDTFLPPLWPDLDAGSRLPGVSFVTFVGPSVD